MPRLPSRARFAGSLSASRDLLRQPVDDRLRRAGGRDEAVPGQHLVLRNAELDHRRHVGQTCKARAARHRQEPHLAGLRKRQRVRQAGEHRRDMPGHEIGHRRRAAAIRHMDHVEARELEEIRHRQMRGVADAARAVGQRARLLFDMGDELGIGLHRHVGVDAEHERIAADHRDRREILHRVVALRADRRADRHLRRVRHQQRVAVGRRTRDAFGGEPAARTDPVLDHERLAETVAQRLPDDARDAVGRAARREADDDFHRPVRPVLRGGGAGCSEGRECGEAESEDRIAHDGPYE